MSEIFRSGWASDGIERLWAARRLLINAQHVWPSFWFDGTGFNDTAKTWTCRQTGTVLTEAGTGTSPALVASPHSSEFATLYTASGKAVQDSGSSFGNVVNEDMALELVFRRGASGGWLLSKFDGGGGVGWYVWMSGAQLALTLDSSTTAYTILSGVLDANRWYHAMIFPWRSGGARWYLNGSVGAAGSAIDTTSYTNTNSFTLGANAGISTTYDDRIALAAGWIKGSWLDTHLQATVAKERASLWLRQSALLNTGGSVTPTVL